MRFKDLLSIYILLGAVSAFIVTFMHVSLTFRNKTLESTGSTTNMATHDHVLERFDSITKSENDDRFYRGLVLANKMKVLLISDPGTDKSAAALNVNIGKFNSIVIYF